MNISNLDAKLDEVTRYSCPLTRSKPNIQTAYQKTSKSRPSGFDYKKILTGFIKYNLSNKNAERYKGFIKLKKDPKGEYFDDSNIIFREEQLKFQSYIYGLVLFAGNDCWAYR